MAKKTFQSAAGCPQIRLILSEIEISQAFRRQAGG